ncbi:MAG: hypothetical protein HHAS10_06730 [Candidatus Altimarinota bacterium]
MRYSTIFLSSILLISVSPLIALSIDPATSGRILDSFKKEEYEILFENSLFDQSGANDIYEKEYLISGIEGLRNRLSQVIKTYEQKKSEVSLQKDSLVSLIANIEENISDTSSEIRKIEGQIEEKKKDINELKNLSIELSVKIKKNRSIMLSYIANVYAEGNLIFDEKNEVDVFRSLILSDENIDNVAQDITYKSLVSSLGQKFIDDYRELIKSYYKIQIRMNDEIALLDIDNEKLEKQKTNLITQRSFREQLLLATQGREELLGKYIESQVNMQKTLEESWKDATNAYTATLENILEKNGCQKQKKTGKEIEKCAHILSFYRNEKALKNVKVSSGTENILTWPLDVVTGITTYFRDPSYYREVGSQHDAIDIPAEQGTQVKASLGGYVYYILPPVSGGYSYMAIKHPNGYFTVYGHLSEVLVKPYQFVEQGDVIAKSGGTPGTPGAGPMTTGPHLHYEVFKNREAIDPLRILDISKLDYSRLPTRYQEKFISDIVARVGSKADLSPYERKFRMEGKTEEERQKYLLNTYATSDFKNWDTWVDISLESKIDPSFLMCVGLAETTLGNYLKTRNNIGNVGNTDGGDVVSFESPREGIYWMASTFNNKFLGSYDSVSELSRWGNSSGYIYASSNANWHNNIIRCLSALKGKFVEDNYKFRLDIDK